MACAKKNFCRISLFEPAEPLERRVARLHNDYWRLAGTMRQHPQWVASYEWADTRGRYQHGSGNGGPSRLMRVVFVPNSPLFAVGAVFQLVLIAALVAQWRRGRRSTNLLTQQRAGVDERTGALIHELNQPLTSILSNAQAAQRFLAADRLDPQELREILDDIITDDKRAAGIVRSIGGRLQGTTDVSDTQT